MDEDLSRNLCFSLHSLRTFLLTTINPGQISYKPSKTSKPKSKPKKLSHPHAVAAESTPLTTSTTTTAQPAHETTHCLMTQEVKGKLTSHVSETLNFRALDYTI